MRALSHLDRRAAGSFALVGLLLLVALLGPLLHGAQGWVIVGDPYIWPGVDPRFPLGTDAVGRDMLTGLLVGTRVSMTVGICAAAAAVSVGTLIGTIAGYAGDWIDDVLMRLTDAFQIVPSFLIALFVIALFGSSLTALVSAIAVASWPGVARLTRTETRRLHAAEFVEASRVAGRRAPGIIGVHILPNMLAPIVTTGSVMVATSILTEAGLSFLGFGDPDNLSLGTIVAGGRGALRSAWYVSLLPALLILAIVLSVNLAGETINRLLDPRRGKSSR